MPIKPLILQRRLTEVGRIRIGELVPTASGKTRPSKLAVFRVTSADRGLLDQIAHLYGGTVEAWTPQGGGASQFEVKTDASAIPVIVPPQSVTQFLEHWSGGGCQRRCDGESNLLTGDACICAANDEMICKPTTRLSVMLRDVESIGVFRLESHGWNAAAELPGMADLLERAGGYVKARLYLKPVRQVSGGKTKDFYVPALAIDGVTPAQLLAHDGDLGVVVNRMTGEITAAPTKAIDPAPSCDEFISRAMESKNADQVRDIWRDAAAVGCIDAPLRIGERETTLSEMLRVLGEGFMKATAEPVAQPVPSESPVAAWTALLASWAGDTQSALDAFARASGGREPAACTADEIAQFAAMMAVPVEPEPDAKSALADPEF